MATSRSPRYCDGGSQTGNVSDAVPVPGGGQVYYRGARIVRALIAELIANTTVNLGAATDVVISGCSAGGLSTFLHAPKWQAALPAAKVVAMPDSGCEAAEWTSRTIPLCDPHRRSPPPPHDP